MADRPHKIVIAQVSDKEVDEKGYPKKYFKGEIGHAWPTSTGGFKLEFDAAPVSKENVEYYIVAPKENSTDEGSAAPEKTAAPIE